MIKPLKMLFALVVLCGQVSAMEEHNVVPAVAPNPIKMKEELRLSGTCGALTYRSITAGDASVIEALVSRCTFKEGLPTNTEEKPEGVNSWAENLITRQQGTDNPNPYSGILFFAEKAAGFLCLGRMPALGIGNGYDLKEHSAIVEKFVHFGALSLKKDAPVDAKFSKEKYDLVPNCGLGMMVPVLPKALGEERTRDALRIGLQVFAQLKERGVKLPLEGTLPGYVIGLYDPADPLIPHLKAVGFDFDENPEFVKFYPPKQRILAYKKL